MENWFDSAKLVDFCVLDGVRYLCVECGKRQGERLVAYGTDVREYISPHPQHCCMGCGCVNRIEIPNDHEALGAALKVPLTVKGIESMRSEIAVHVLYGSDRQGLIARLWHHLYQDIFQDRLIAVSTNRIPLRLTTRIAPLLSSSSFLSSVVLTDLRYMYCMSSSPSYAGIWRMVINNMGKLELPTELVEIPSSEFNDRDHFAIIEEAVSSGAWD